VGRYSAESVGGNVPPSAYLVNRGLRQRDSPLCSSPSGDGRLAPMAPGGGAVGVGVCDHRPAGWWGGGGILPTVGISTPAMHPTFWLVSVAPCVTCLQNHSANLSESSRQEVVEILSHISHPPAGFSGCKSHLAQYACEISSRTYIRSKFRDVARPADGPDPGRRGLRRMRRRRRLERLPGSPPSSQCRFSLGPPARSNTPPSNPILPSPT